MAFVKTLFVRHPILTQFMGWLIIPALVLAVILYRQLMQALPAEREQLQAAFLSAAADISRDNLGMATVTAAKDTDAFFSLGYMHAQDRLWQMEYQRRLGQGRLSEIFGKESLNTDRYMRTLGIYRAAEKAYGYLSGEGKLALDAYVKGVNHWLARAPELPLEFKLFGFEPAPWTYADSLVQIKLLALNLGANYRHELQNEMLLKQLGKARFEQLLVSDQETGAVVASHGEDGDRGEAFARQLAGLDNYVGELYRQLDLGLEGVGSNAWVVSGRHTRSGLPVLANDPHLALSLPTTFYLARLKGDKINVAGATLPGLPMVIFGKNADITWGATNLAADVQDLYIERVDRADSNLYQLGDRWQPFTSREEIIKVAADFPALLHQEYQPVKWLVRESVHGPLISDVLNDAKYPMALRWTALDADDTSFDSIFAVNYARDWQGFRQALADLVAPALGFVYADNKDNTGFIAAGRIPVRAGGRGLMPSPGWDGQHSWQRYLGIDEYVQQTNPESGVIVTANNRIHGADYPYLISNNWKPGYRARRIKQLLEGHIQAGHAMQTRDFVTLQQDVVDLQAGEIKPFLAALKGEDGRQQELLAILEHWDMKMDGDSIGATVYRIWLNHFTRLVVGDELLENVIFPGLYARLSAQANESRPIFLRELLKGKHPLWCDVVTTAPRENCADIALLALTQTYEELSKLSGGDASQWQWSRLHETAYSHKAFSFSQLMSLIFDRDKGAQGGFYTVNVSGNHYVKGEGYRRVLGASYRQVVDMGAPELSVFGIDLGQSGQMLSPHYDDFLYRQAMITMDIQP
ncbi:penicillin acylase family protein [Thalassomonas viridans]|uniref:Penicillin acylase family protein n=1 Tax=Thalassomonas viridans TaxID=137584 RepID=A0AAE9Z9K4_9GAMM|nr:penicillin acylase family protein [Thalassomonas viridans]WDE09265.1 penicillin acylase family protein [Thalassomonas viridans]